MSSKKLADIPLSVLDLVPVLTEKTPADSFRNTVDLAQHVERWGYKRYWMAEHHNMAGIASSATSILIGHVARETFTIRVGSGGVMLPNHAPLIVAEQFGTLESLYPGRIDLGLGRAPGTDQLTSMALRRDLRGAVDDFPQNVEEIRQYFAPADPTARVRAVPGEGLEVPIWILGSSTYGAQLAAYLGLPYAFASHFAPASLHAALKLYKENFRPSESLQEPYALACVNVVAADTDKEAEFLATTMYMSFLNVVRGTAKKMQPPVESMDGLWDTSEKYSVLQMLQYSFIGGPTTVQEELQGFLDSTQVDEIMVNSHIYEHAARLRSYEILSQLQDHNTGR
ncbi:luciferase family oxidoreductase group 1 [Pontibacter ummariensis]|uniref:Luciferase-like monooxygenase n=1 Tax=Pontibacter ummariensis TaxID=1610492 RepID=A0A239D270_9BACT|nr:LLM class flavin-dependent oxidoreductase [Pontibacter ummariensis]PRY14197.1 luciferase family oxidoreductase group 1 [Pontibacter ummariensis]SNS26242.1 luciferase family oxidoreductase, group 1 [Pontibacter ummariensis]